MTFSIKKLIFQLDCSWGNCSSEARHALKSQLRAKEISILEIISQLPDTFRNSSYIRKTIIHLIVKFEENSEILKTHLLSLKQLVPEKDRQYFVEQFFRHCLYRKRNELIPFFLGLLNPGITLNEGITKLVVESLEHHRFERLLWLVKTYELDGLDHCPDHRQALIAFLSYCLRHEESALVEKLESKISDQDFRDYFWMPGLLLQEDLLPLLKHFGLDKFLNLSPFLNLATVLAKASQFSNQEVVSWCFEQGAEVNGNISHYRIKTIEIFEIFLKQKPEINVNEPDYDGYTLLHYAILNRDINGAEVEFIAYLLEKGADPNLTDRFKNTSLHMLCALPTLRNDWKKIAESLLNARANPDARNQRGKTPLHLICSRSSSEEEFVKLLLIKGANPNAVDQEDNTPLQTALDFRNDGVAFVLLANGADIRTLPLLKLYLQDLEYKINRCEKIVILPKEREDRELLELCLFILKCSYEHRSKEKNQLRKEIDSVIALKMTTPERKRRFLKSSFELPILFNYLLEHYLDDLYHCFKDTLCLNPSSSLCEKILPLLTPTQISQVVIHSKEKIPFEGKIYTIGELLAYGYNTYLNVPPEFRSLRAIQEILRVIPPQLLAIMTSDFLDLSTQLFLKHYLYYCNEAQMRVIIPRIGEHFIPLIQKYLEHFQVHKIDPTPFQLACLKAATVKQRKAFFFAHGEHWNLSIALDEFKNTLKQLQQGIPIFEQMCNELILNKAEEKYELLAQTSSVIEDLARKLKLRIQGWINLFEAVNNREMCYSPFHTFLDRRQKEARPLLAKIEELFKEKERLFAERNKLLIDSLSNEKNIPYEFICPISQEVMNDPVTTPSGHTYDRVSIERWIQEGKSSDPLNPQIALTLSDLKPNDELRNKIEAWERKS